MWTKTHGSWMAENAIRCIEDTVIFSQDDVGATNTIMILVNRNYELAYMKRWISLFVLNNLATNESLRKDQDKNICKIKEKLVELIVSSTKIAIPTTFKKIE